MSRRHRPIRTPEWLLNHPPKSCKPLVSKSVLKLLDELKTENLTRKENSVK